MHDALDAQQFALDLHHARVDDGQPRLPCDPVTRPRKPIGRKAWEETAVRLGYGSLEQAELSLQRFMDDEDIRLLRVYSLCAGTIQRCECEDEPGAAEEMAPETIRDPIPAMASSSRAS